MEGRSNKPPTLAASITITSAGPASGRGKAAVFLACDDSSYINGTTIVLDGGTMAVW